MEYSPGYVRSVRSDLRRHRPNRQLQPDRFPHTADRSWRTEGALSLGSTRRNHHNCCSYIPRIRTLGPDPGRHHRDASCKRRPPSRHHESIPRKSRKPGIQYHCPHRAGGRGRALKKSSNSWVKPDGSELAESKPWKEKSHRASVRTLQHAFGIVAMFVIETTLAGITEDLVCLGNTLEALFRYVITRIDVRMVSSGQFSVSPLDFTYRGTLSNSENDVQICH